LVLPRLYAILDFDHVRSLGLDPLVVVRTWLDAGVRLVQLRAKTLTLGPCLELAGEMGETCREAGAIFIVNDRVDVARLSGAAGVHVGQDDLSPEEARQLLPDAPWIGLSTHTDEQMAKGLDGAATYVATGPVFATGTKVGASPVVGLDGVRRVAALTERAGRPLVAIGGITLETAPDVVNAGADSVAVISDLLRGGDVAGRARAFVRALT
jgi:thiamine-phosphate pyrophosphorylase